MAWLPPACVGGRSTSYHAIRASGSARACTVFCGDVWVASF